MKTLMEKRIRNAPVSHRDGVLRVRAAAQDASRQCQILAQADVAKERKDAHTGQLLQEISD
jgi:hypothetical protein